MAHSRLPSVTVKETFVITTERQSCIVSQRMTGAECTPSCRGERRRDTSFLEILPTENRIVSPLD